MSDSKLVGLLTEAWKDFDRVLNGLDSSIAVQNLDGGSSFAWTLGHVTNQVDRMISVRFLEQEQHPLIGHERFGFGGPGVAEDWVAIQSGVRDVRDAVSGYLSNKSDQDLEVVVPYDGSMGYLRQTGLGLRYTLFRIITHHYFHIGEISTKRDRIGHQVGDYPSALMTCL